MTLLCLCGNALALFGPSLAGRALNAAAAGKGKVDFALVRHYALQMLFCYLTSAFLAYAVGLLMMRTARLLGKEMRRDIFDKLMKLPVVYFDQNQAGDIISRVSYDVDVICTSFSTDLVQILASTVTVVGSCVMMRVICPQLIIVTLVAIPAAIAFTRYMGRRTRPLFSHRSAKYGEMNGFVEEMFSGQKSILAYAYTDGVSEDYDRINEEAADAFYKAEYYGMSIGPSVGAINNISLSLTGMLGSLLFLS
ncbi:MAG: ABC transporter ATP-binding protein, partial [Eggerthellaceae bacterium]|nr:ABC transporter ATP-binding protein [Eggerthellaceae bacterium]